MFCPLIEHNFFWLAGPRQEILLEAQQNSRQMTGNRTRPMLDSMNWDGMNLSSPVASEMATHVFSLQSVDDKTWPMLFSMDWGTARGSSSLSHRQRQHMFALLQAERPYDHPDLLCSVLVYSLPGVIIDDGNIVVSERSVYSLRCCISFL